ncbi:hypothetical protein [Microlunatus endophyticus]
MQSQVVGGFDDAGGAQHRTGRAETQQSDNDRGNVAAGQVPLDPVQAELQQPEVVADETSDDRCVEMQRRTQRPQVALCGRVAFTAFLHKLSLPLSSTVTRGANVPIGSGATFAQHSAKSEAQRGCNILSSIAIHSADRHTADREFLRTVGRDDTH